MTGSTPRPVATLGYATGDHRAVTADETLARFTPLLGAIGATRLSVVTGLDVVGIPVAMVCRPNSRSLSVSQGKGVDLASAKVSAIGESIECWHAEHIVRPLRRATFGELSEFAAVADPETLARPVASRFHPDLTMLWVEASDLLTGQPVYLPYELVHLDRRLPRPEGHGCYLNTSTGLATGNHLLEAVSHALCEVVERDAVALWHCRSEAGRASRLVDPDTVDDDTCVGLVERFRQAGLAVGIGDLTTDVGLATFMVSVVESRPDLDRRVPAARGFGCHPRRSVALARALTEAAQSRLTMIVGTRDDWLPSDHRRVRDVGSIDDSRRATSPERAPRAFHDVADATRPSIDADVAYELDRLRGADVGQVLLVELTRPDLGVAVVRIVIPGLEALDPNASSHPGPRARALLRQGGDDSAGDGHPAGRPSRG